MITDSFMKFIFPNSLPKDLNGLSIIGIFILGAIISIAFNILLSRLIGGSGYGNFKVAEAFFYFGGLIAMMGGAAAAPKFLKDQLMSDLSNGCWHYIKFYSLIALVVSLILMFIVFIGHNYHVSTFDNANYHPILIATVIIPVYAISNLLCGVLHSANKLKLAFWPWFFGYASLNLVICYLYFIIFGTLTDTIAIFLVLTVATILIISNLFSIRNLHLMPIRKSVKILLPKSWLAVSVPMMIAACLQYLMQKLDIFMIEFLAGETAVGDYAASLSINNMFYCIQLGLTAIFAPKIARAALDGIQSNKHLVLQGAKLCMLVTLPFIIIFTFWGDYLLSLYHHDTEFSYKSLLILMVGYVITAIFSVAIVWLQYNGNARAIMGLLVMGVSMNIMLNRFLIPIFDIEGAAFATTASMLSFAFGVAVLIQRKLSIINIKKSIFGTENSQLT